MANVEVILTFDDGPLTAGSDNGTDNILSELKTNPTGRALKAVFFIQSHARDDNGNHNRGMHDRGKQLVKKMTDDGHFVGVHTGMDAYRAHAKANNHPNRYNAQQLAGDLTRAKDFIRDYAKQTARYVRPPFGDMDEYGNVQRRYNEAALYHIRWDIESGDATSGSTKASVKQQLTRDVGNKVRGPNGDRKLVILFHDTKSVTNSPGNLGEYITTITDAIEDEGHTPVWNLSTARIRTILDEYGERTKQRYQ